jgi:hypothetical protein
VCINPFESADALNSSSPEESIDQFSRREVYLCFEDMQSLEEFVDAVKQSCASASQLLNYIDSLPLAPKRDKSSLGTKGCVFLFSAIRFYVIYDVLPVTRALINRFSLLRGIADIGASNLPV